MAATPQSQSAPAVRSPRAPHVPGAARVVLGRWQGELGPGSEQDERGNGLGVGDDIAALGALDRPVYAVELGEEIRFVNHGKALLDTDPLITDLGHQPAASGGRALLGFAAPLPIERLGDPSFARDYGARYPYMTGAMANGIASVALVSAATRAGLVSAYGAAGQDLTTVQTALDELDRALGPGRYLVNVIHSPNEPHVEAGLVELLLRRNIRQVEASAYLALTPAIVRYRLRGVHLGEDGALVIPNRIIAKASRVEVASQWLGSPAPKLVEQLRAAGQISEHEAALAPRVAMADDLTAEADSGGHTDNRPAVAMLPTFIALRNRLQATGELATHRGFAPTRIGAAGGMSTPGALAGAFAMGAAYVVTGSINQACVEAGTSDPVRRMLAECGQADVAMAPAADMFEMGVKLQVLKRGTLFAMRASRLFEIYRGHDCLDDLSPTLRASLERDLFRAPLEQIWQRTGEFFAERNPAMCQRAEVDPKLKMALVFRWYLGQSSRWANRGEPDRAADYQVWCGPAMGAFNEWTAGSALAAPEARTVAHVAMTLLRASAMAIRARQLASTGLAVPAPALYPTPELDLQ